VVKSASNFVRLDLRFRGHVYAPFGVGERGGPVVVVKIPDAPTERADVEFVLSFVFI